MKPIIEVNHLYKKYKIGEKQRYYSFRDTLVNLTKLPFRQKAKLKKEEFWALKDISFKVMPGEVMGIIGRNGAGKSTLLKILSRITPPTKGEITLRGRVASLLEVGTGFHPELTGRENIYLNGAILGMRRSEINDKFYEIVDFAEISKFLDTPVKHYSSGMYMRLAFAIAAHLEPEILLVDEVLAVGDVEFQKKCLGKMKEVSDQGRTVLFVSHNMAAVKELCNKAILLSQGILKREDETHQVVNLYLGTKNKATRINMNNFHGTLTKRIIYKKASINNSEKHVSIRPFSDITLAVIGECKEDISAFRVTFSIYAKGERIISMHDTKKPEVLPKGEFKSEVTIPGLLLRPGTYSIALGGYRDGMSEWLWGTDLFEFTILEEWGKNYQQSDIGLINLPFNGKRIAKING